MGFEFTVALRQLTAKRSRTLSVVSWLSITGVALGVAALVTGFSITTGFEQAFQDKVVAFTSHVLVRQYGLSFDDHERASKQVSKVDGVVATSPMTHHGGLFSGPAGSVGAVIKGVVPSRAAAVLDIGMVDGESPFRLLASSGDDDVDGVLLGEELARRLGAEVGGHVTVLAPQRGLEQKTWKGQEGSLGTKTFKVRGVFRAGFHEYDSRLAFMRLEVAQAFFGTGNSITGLEVRVENPMGSGAIAQEIDAALGRGEFSVYDWRQQNRNLFASLTYQRIAIIVVLSVMVILAACNVACLLIMLVLERTRDIAILKAMGTSRGSLIRIFLLHGLVIGALGTAAGLLLAFGLSQGVLAQGIDLDPKVYGVDHFPVVFQWSDYLMATITALVITLSSAIVPAYRAARLEPVDGLREIH